VLWNRRRSLVGALLKLVLALAGGVLGVPAGFFVGVAPGFFLREYPILRPFGFRAYFQAPVALSREGGGGDGTAGRKQGERVKGRRKEQVNKER